MPPVKPLTGKNAKPATPVQVKKPEKEKVTITKDDVGTVDAADIVKANPRETQALAKAASAVAVPSWLQKSTMPAVQDKQVGNYIGFASSASGKWGEQQNAGLEDGQPFLFRDSQYQPLKNLSFFLLAGESFKTLMVGKEGKFHWASRDLEEEGPTKGSNRPEEHYVTLMLLDVDGKLIPIKGDFRGTKSGGMASAIRAVEAAGTQQWLSENDRHKVTSAYPHPYGRVYHTMSTHYRVSKTSGNPYFYTTCVCSPSTIAQMQMLIDAFADKEFLLALNEAKTNYDGRISFLDRVVAGEIDK